MGHCWFCQILIQIVHQDGTYHNRSFLVDSLSMHDSYHNRQIGRRVFSAVSVDVFFTATVGV